MMCMVLYYNFLCNFSWISSISRLENQPFLMIVLTWSASFLACCLESRTILPDLYHSFLVSSLRRVALKLSMWGKLIIFPSPCFALRSLIVVVSYVVIDVLEKRAANICRMTIGSPMLAIKRAPADYDIQACSLSLTFV